MSDAFDGHVVRDLIGGIAVLGLLAVAYGTAMRWAPRGWIGQLALGLAFGGAAGLAMLDPVVVAPGVLADLRAVPVALAGAFLGVVGMVAAAAVAVAARIALGGEGAFAGVASLLLAGLLGLLWARLERARGMRGLPPLLALPVLVSFHWTAVLLLPAEVARAFAVSVLPFVAPLEVAGLLVLGALLERERRLLLGERRLEVDAERDGLTGLLNRRGFERAVARLPQGERGALLLLDLDHFKGINDAHGHPGGDAVLRALGARLARALGARDVLARLGGEEVAVFLPGVGAAAAQVSAQSLREAVSADPFALPDGGLVEVTASLGGAMGSPARLEPLMVRADAALYRAKAAGRDRVRFDLPSGPAAPPERSAGLRLAPSWPGAANRAAAPGFAEAAEGFDAEEGPSSAEVEAPPPRQGSGGTRAQ